MILLETKSKTQRNLATTKIVTEMGFGIQVALMRYSG